MAANFKEWVNDPNGNRTLEEEISDLEDQNSELMDEIDEVKEYYNDLLDELEEIKASIEEVISSYGDRH